MKRILTIVCCAVVLFAISSCTKNYVTPNNTETVYAKIPPSAWTLYTVDNKSYMAPITVPEIGPGFAQTGGLIVAISYTNGVYESIPEVYNGTSFSYTYNTGNVTLYAQSPDGSTPVQPTDTVRVKITLVATQ